MVRLNNYDMLVKNLISIFVELVKKITKNYYLLDE